MFFINGIRPGALKEFDQQQADQAGYDQHARRVFCFYDFQLGLNYRVVEIVSVLLKFGGFCCFPFVLGLLDLAQHSVIVVFKFFYPCAFLGTEVAPKALSERHQHEEFQDGEAAE